MQDKIDALKTACESLRTARQALDNLVQQEAELKAAREKLQLQLADIPVESLALPSGDDKAFDRPTSRMLSARHDIGIKLDLLPSIRVRYRAQAEGLGQRIRIAAKSLVHHCRDAAEVKFEQAETELTAYLSKYYPGDGDAAKAAAAKALRATTPWEVGTVSTQGANACKWLATFSQYSHAADPLEDAQNVISLAETFTRDGACN
jgi:hypothetical protein